MTRTKYSDEFKEQVVREILEKEVRELRRADALRPIAPPLPARGPPGAGSPVRRAPSVVPGRSPATDPNPPAGSRPRRASGPAPSPFAHAPQTHPPGRSGTGQGAPAPTRSHGSPAHRGASRVRA